MEEKDLNGRPNINPLSYDASFQRKRFFIFLEKQLEAVQQGLLYLCVFILPLFSYLV